jgi:hypothetical protein
MAKTMWKLVKLIFWLIVLAYLAMLNRNLDARGGAVGETPGESVVASQAQGASEVGAGDPHPELRRLRSVN